MTTDQLLTELRARIEVAHAQRDAFAAVLADLLRQRRGFEFSDPAEQELVRYARAMLARWAGEA
jgi:hypothetical protein